MHLRGEQDRLGIGGGRKRRDVVEEMVADAEGSRARDEVSELTRNDYIPSGAQGYGHRPAIIRDGGDGNRQRLIAVDAMKPALREVLLRACCRAAVVDPSGSQQRPLGSAAGGKIGVPDDFCCDATLQFSIDPAADAEVAGKDLRADCERQCKDNLITRLRFLEDVYQLQP